MPGSLWGSPAWGWGPWACSLCTEGLGNAFGSEGGKVCPLSVLLRCPPPMPQHLGSGPRPLGAQPHKATQQGGDKPSVDRCSHRLGSGREGRARLTALVQQRECPMGGGQCGGQMAGEGAQVAPGSGHCPAQRCYSQEGFRAVGAGPAACSLPGKGPALSPGPQLASGATGKASSEPCLFLQRFNWLGKEVSLVKRDLTVGHCESEGLRREEREGLSPFIFPRAGPSMRPSWRELLTGKGLSPVWEPECFLRAKERPPPAGGGGSRGLGRGFPGFLHQPLEGRGLQTAWVQGSWRTQDPSMSLANQRVPGPWRHSSRQASVRTGSGLGRPADWQHLWVFAQNKVCEGDGAGAPWLGACCPRTRSMSSVTEPGLCPSDLVRS